jgi:hypothetical protein
MFLNEGNKSDREENDNVKNKNQKERMALLKFLVIGI